MWWLAGQPPMPQNLATTSPPQCHCELAYVDPLLLDNRIEGWDAAWSEREKYNKGEKVRVAYQEKNCILFY